MGVKYRVLDIDQNTQILHITRDDFSNDLLCSPTYPNTTFDLDQFEYAPDFEGVTLYYDCPPAVQGMAGYFNCTHRSTHKNGIIGNEPQTMGCNSSLRVGMRRSYFGVIWDLPKLAEALKEGFGLKYKVDTWLCSNCTKSGGACGYDMDSKQPTCYCADGSSGQRPCPLRKESSSNRNLAIGISAALVGLLFSFAIMLYIFKRKCSSIKAMFLGKEDNREDFDVEAFIRNYTSFAPKRYYYSHVKKMTNSFANEIGKGGFGCVYKGTLPDDRLVAVKVLKESKSNGEDFINEVASMGRTSHVNIVTLVGFCYERNKRALIYDFMPNGSLDKFISNPEHENATDCLDWNRLYEIALGIARGLEYLHCGCNTRILHFDIKPQNILLDKDFCPKISDFGLAKLWLNKESIVSMMGARGTAGYIAPEVFSRNFGGVSHKSDVYSYGMLVLEMVGGGKNIDPRVSHTSETNFSYWIYEDVELGTDLGLLGVTTEEEKEIAMKMLLVSFWCIQTNPSDRPPMSKVVDMLEGDLQHVQIPPKPFLVSPARSPQQSTESSL
nr:LEAF RUST 10 DISEASE-RESISTANCE LOCUS RECEPTOR-LIKE PROTEIN KINASE-like 2.4 [Ziziphus jujuba var. spinosa]